jgi:hypothetical protein
MRKSSRRRDRPTGERPELSQLQSLFTIDEVARKAQRSRASVYRDIAAKRLEVTKIGCSTRVTPRAYEKYTGISA